MGWSLPGKEANSGRWRYDLRRGFVPPGSSTDREGTQYEMPQGFSPESRPTGFHVVQSPPGTAAPIDAVNYTPSTKEVSDVGVLAPVDKTNVSLIPDSGLQRLAYNRRRQRAAVGAGADVVTGAYPGTPPLTTREPQKPSAIPVNTLGMAATSAPPGAPFGRQPLGLGSGQDDTDPTTIDATQPGGDETQGGTDPNWANVGPEYAGHRRIDSDHIAEMVAGKPIGIWTRKPGVSEGDPNQWTYHSLPKDVAGDEFEDPIRRDDGSLWQRNKRTNEWHKLESPAKQSAKTTWGAPYVDANGSLVQQSSGGEIRVVERSSSRAPRTTWSDPYQAPDGTWVQKSSEGELRQVPTTKPTSANEQWSDQLTKPDGSVWQQNLTTKRWEVISGPTKGVGTPITVGRRLVQFNPDTNTYQEVYRAPQNMQLMTMADGTIVGIDPESGNAKPLLSDPAAAEDERLKQMQTAMQTAATEMGMIPQVSISGGNLIVPRGVEANVHYYDPWTGKTTDTTMGHHETVPDILKSYGLPPISQPQATKPTEPVAPATQPKQPDIPVPPAAAPPQAPQPFVQSGLPEGRTAAPQPFVPSGLPEGRPVPTAPPDQPPPEDVPPPEEPPPDEGAGADSSKTSYDIGKDLRRDIPMFGRKRKWKGLGSRYLGTGLDDFQPFVGVGQDMPTGPGMSPPPTPPAGQGSPLSGSAGGDQWNPQKMQQLLPLLIMLLSGGGTTPGGTQSSLPPGGGSSTPSPGGLGGPLGGGAEPFDPGDFLDMKDFVREGWQGGPRPETPGGMDMYDTSNRQNFDPLKSDMRVGESGRPAGRWNVGRTHEQALWDAEHEGGRGEPLGETMKLAHSKWAARGGGSETGETPTMLGPAMGTRLNAMLGVLNLMPWEDMLDTFMSGSDVPDWREGKRKPVGTGQDDGDGGDIIDMVPDGTRWRPPVDPQNVVGTGHKYGQKMAVGDPTHHGVDLQAPKGTPAKAPVDGIVQVRNNSQGLGNEVAVVSPDGKEHRLGHLNTVSVKPGQQVKAGQVVGTVGDSGLTTGANLHYDVRKGARHFDPSKRLGALASMTPAAGTEMMTSPGAGAEAQDLGVGAGGMRLANGNWSDALADTPENQAKYGQGSGYSGNYGYGGPQGAPGKTGSVGGGGVGGGGGGGDTNVAISPADKARLDLDTQIAQWNHDQQTAQLQQQQQSEKDRHDEAVQQLQQQAQQEGDWKAVQESINQENNRHNQEMEKLQQQQQKLDVELETMKEQSAAQLQESSQKFQAGQTAQQNALSTFQTALANPWLQALTKLGITPGGGGSSGSNPLMQLLQSILGGFGGSLGASGAFAGGGQLPKAPTAQEWTAMNPADKAALRAQVEAMGPGAWEQFQANFQNQAGTTQAPDMTRMQSATQSPMDQVGTQMNAEMFGEGLPGWQQRQQQTWNKSKGTNVMQSLLAGTGWG